MNGLMYESIKIMGYDILEPSGEEFAGKILDVIDDVNQKLQKQYDAPHNMEQTPINENII